jgi:two-component system response regulator AtoC
VSGIHSRTTAEVDIRNLYDPTASKGRASLIFQHGDAVEVVHLLAPRDQVVVGRTFPADVRVDIASLSRQHARFSFARGRLQVEDLGSRNGTWVGAERVQKRKLASGDQVRMGELSAVVALHRPPPEAAPPPPEAAPPPSEAAPLPSDTEFGPVVEGALVKNAAMQKLYQTVHRAAQNLIPVLIVGETGTGKELVARALHALGDRARERFGVVNCGAIPENLTESILFGHEKGAFTGADRRRAGLFEQSHGGVVFLDEICEMPLETQSSLLRVLESKRVCRLGGSEEIEVDVRVIAATHCDPEQLVAEGAFRQDLLFRLNVLNLRVPPLRDRIDEIEPLAMHFLEQACQEWDRSVHRIEPEALDLLRNYAWPGNIRQLRNVIERGVLLCEGGSLRSRDLPPAVVKGEASSPGTGTPLSADKPAAGRAAGAPFKSQMDAHEARIIAEAVQKTAGNQRAAARLLRIPYRTMMRKVKKYRIKYDERGRS